MYDKNIKLNSFLSCLEKSELRNLIKKSDT